MDKKEIKHLYHHARLQRGKVGYLIGENNRAENDLEYLTTCDDIDISILVDSYIHLGYIKSNSSKYTEAIEYYDEAFKIAIEYDYKFGELQSRVELAFSYIEMKKFKKSLEICRELLKNKNFLHDHMKLYSLILNTMGSAYLYLTNYKKAIDYYNRGIEIDKEIGDRVAFAKKSNNIGIIHKNMGNYDKALLLFGEALKTFEEIQFPYLIASVANNIGFIYYYLKDYKNSIKYFKKAKAISEKYNYRNILKAIINHLGNIYYNKKQYITALKYYIKSENMSNEDKMPGNSAKSNIGSVYLSMGKLDQAEKYLLLAKRGFEKTGNLKGIIVAELHLGELKIKRGKDAAEYFKDLRKKAEELGLNSIIIEIDKFL